MQHPATLQGFKVMGTCWTSYRVRYTKLKSVSKDLFRRKEEKSQREVCPAVFTSFCSVSNQSSESGSPHHRPIRSPSSLCPPPACRLDLSSSLIALALFPAPPSSWQHSPIFIVLDFLLGEVISQLFARHSLLRLPLHLHTHADTHTLNVSAPQRSHKRFCPSNHHLVFQVYSIILAVHTEHARYLIAIRLLRQSYLKIVL